MTDATADAPLFEGWVILELYGHRRLAGYVSEQEIAGKGFLRLDVPNDDEPEKVLATQFYAAGSIYAITPTSEETARVVAKRCRPTPATRWELEPARPERDYDDDAAEPW